MEKTFGTALAPTSAKKVVARAALVNLKESSRFLLTECFRQFGIESVVVSSRAAERLHQEKFEACVVNLVPGTEAIMEAARTSPSNSRLVLYGLGGSAQEAMRYSRYGINAMFQEPLERPAAHKLVRATHMLVLHEFRRYARIQHRDQFGRHVGKNRRGDALRDQRRGIFFPAHPPPGMRERNCELAQEQV